MIDRSTFEGAKNPTKFLYLFDEIRELREDVKGRQKIDRYVAVVSGALGGIGAILIVMGKITWSTIKTLFL